MKCDIGRFTGKQLEKYRLDYIVTRIMGALHEDVRTFITVFAYILKTRNVSDKSGTEKQNTHFTF
jgi:hypothetical protein